MTRPRFGRIATLIVALAVLPSSLTMAQAPERRPFSKAGTPRKLERARTYDVRHIRGDLRFDVVKSEIRGTSTITFSPLSRVGDQSATIDCGPELKVSQVTIGAKPCQFEHQGNELRLTLDRVYQPNETCTVVIHYAGSPTRGVRFIKPSPDFPGRKACAWTVGEPEDAHNWIPCYDSPNDRFTSEMVVTVDKPLMAVSNGDLLSSKDNPDGTSTYHWKLDRELTAYLMSIDIAEFNVYHDKLGDLPVDYYVLKEVDEATARRAMGKAPKMIDFFNNSIGTAYPYNRYAQVCIPEFGGGMEHTSKTTMTDSILVDAIAHRDRHSDSLVAHELAHQWFGDLMTCRDWSNLWLNEGFASYFDVLFAEHDRGEDAFRLVMANHLSNYLGSDRGYRRPIVETRYGDPWSMFDSVTYDKGACILHALRGTLGDDAWWKGIREYVAEHKGKNVETADLRKSLEKSTGRDLGWFFDQWVFHGGHPELKASWRYEDSDKSVRIKVEQVQQVDEITPLFRLSTTIELGDDAGIRSIPVVIDGKTHEFIIPSAGKPKMVRIDPKGWIPKTLDFEKSADEWTYQLAHAPDVLGRIEAASALVKSHKGDSTTAALAKAWSSERDPGARSLLVGRLGSSGEGARSALIAAARDSDANVRSAAFSALENLKFGEDVEALYRSAWADKTESYRVRNSALRALTSAKVKDADDLLKEALADPAGDHALGRTALGILLARRGQEGRETAVIHVQPGQPPAFRVMAAGALSRSARDDAQAQKLLLGLLDDPSAGVRMSAASGLLEIATPENLARVEAALSHVDGPMRPMLEARLKSLKEPKKRAAVVVPKEADDLDRQATDLERKARELRHRAESIRIGADKKEPSMIPAIPVGL